VSVDHIVVKFIFLTTNGRFLKRRAGTQNSFFRIRLKCVLVNMLTWPRRLYYPKWRPPTKFLPKGSYQNAPAKKVSCNIDTLGNIGPGPKDSCKKSSCQKGFQDQKVPTEWLLGKKGSWLYWPVHLKSEDMFSREDAFTS
jgi:hypothetical protein